MVLFGILIRVDIIVENTCLDESYQGVYAESSRDYTVSASLVEKYEATLAHSIAGVHEPIDHQCIRGTLS